MIKCSICSYQCDNWYSSNRKIACHANFSLGRSFLELARGHLTCCPGIALRWVRHTLRGNQTLNLLAFQPCQLIWMIWYASWLTCETWESIGPFELSVRRLDLSAPMPRYCGVRTFPFTCNVHPQYRCTDHPQALLNILTYCFIFYRHHAYASLRKGQ